MWQHEDDVVMPCGDAPSPCGVSPEASGTGSLSEVLLSNGTWEAQQGFSHVSFT